MFGWFKSPHKKALDLVGGMFGVSTKGMEMTSEAEEWLEELSPDDPRRKRVPPGLLKAEYYLVSRPREQGFIIRVYEDSLEVRLPFELVLPDGMRLPNSHLLRALPVRALMALGNQKAQKVVQNLTDDARETFMDHHKTCRVCFTRYPPERYPGHPNEGILGPSAYKFITCASCEAKAAASTEEKKA